MANEELKKTFVFAIWTLAPNRTDLIKAVETGTPVESSLSAVESLAF